MRDYIPILARSTYSNLPESTYSISQTFGMKTTYSFAALATAMVSATITPKADLPNPADVQMRVHYAGTGCPDNSITATISPDRAVLKFIFDAFQVSTGPETPTSESRKTCAFTLVLEHPAGYQYALESALWHGWAQLDDGVDLRLDASTFFASEPPAATSVQIHASSKSGSLNWSEGQVFTKVDEVLAFSRVYSSCVPESVVFLNTRAMLTSQDPRAFGSTAEENVVTSLDLTLDWRQCS